MPWETIAHRCKLPLTFLPAFGGPAFGSIWRCDDCGQRWEFTARGFIRVER
jgi:hypothetical protein